MNQRLILGPASTALEIMFAVGGLYNILKAENCMTRLRLHLKTPSPANDKDFLELGAIGVSHVDGQLHLIYGASSIILKQALQNLLDAKQDTLSFSLMIALGGAANVEKLIAHQDSIELMLIDPSHTISPSSKINFVRKGASVFLESKVLPAENLHRNIQNCILYWDYLYAAQLYKAFHNFHIKNVSYCYTRLKLNITISKALPAAVPSLGINPLIFQKERSELHIPCGPRGESYASMLEKIIKSEENK